MLERDGNALKAYQRLRPSWKQMVKAATRMIVGRIDEDGPPFVSDGFWLLVNATLPNEAREIMENKARWSGHGLLNAPTTLREENATLAEQTISTMGVALAELVTMRTDDGRVNASGYDSILILRTKDRDISVNPRAARWVEKHTKDAGNWYAEIENHSAPLRYITRGKKVIGLLIPYRLGAVCDWRGWGVEWDEKTQRYCEEGE